MGVIRNKGYTSLNVFFTQSAVLLLLYMATCINSLPINSQDVEDQGGVNLNSLIKPKWNGIVSERQRTILKSFQRLLKQRKLSKDKEQSANLSPDDMSFQKYFSSDNSLLKGRIDKLVQDYQRDLDWYRNSRVLKRETPQDSEDPVVSHHSRRSEDLSQTRYLGRRHIRHSRRRFMGKSERSGWGGAYG